MTENIPAMGKWIVEMTSCGEIYKLLTPGIGGLISTRLVLLASHVKERFGNFPFEPSDGRPTESLLISLSHPVKYSRTAETISPWLFISVIFIRFNQL